ncbi:MAG: excalibur calcium-binding domain-containing protein [Fluviicoccus sp.]|uniref:excalibur calcium-binding domain-containing protein n=1 Tax=Fluviicoccus sp. TaxID=2003552 RepID=UPI002726A655|nr:excalibur calcium-binding domain-containing protein [Fluviicoccus sp.]MDO8329224.1 excalibur calcium-binding domain-containing protein [Fluviicoccus sp.]
MKQLEGTLSQWDNASGTGIITPVHGDQRYAVALADFSLGKSKPQLGEELLFEAGVDANGQPCARSVTRPVHALPPPPDEMRDYIPARISRPASSSSGFLPLIIMLGLGAYGYHVFFENTPDSSLRKPDDVMSKVESMAPKVMEKLRTTLSTSSYKCDGRTYCSQMTSCEEAQYFLENCPNVNMDGNQDGVPCEKQWCGNDSDNSFTSHDDDSHESRMKSRR